MDRLTGLRKMLALSLHDPLPPKPAPPGHPRLASVLKVTKQTPRSKTSQECQHLFHAWGPKNLESRGGVEAAEGARSPIMAVFLQLLCSQFCSIWYPPLGRKAE